MASTPSSSQVKPRRGRLSQMLWTIAGGVFSAFWVLVCGAYMLTFVGLKNVSSLPPHDIGLFLAGLFSLPGVIWIALGYHWHMRALERSNRILARHFREFVQFSQVERQKIDATAEAAKREALSLFEAAQASLAALTHTQATLRHDAAALADTAEKSVGQLANASRLLQESTGAVRVLAGEFQAGSGALHEQIQATKASAQGLLGSLDEAGRSLGMRSSELEESTGRTVSRLQTSGEAIQVTIASLADAAFLLESRRGQMERTGETVLQTLQQAGNSLEDTLQGAGQHVSGAATRLTDSALQASDRLFETARILEERTHGVEDVHVRLITHNEGLRDVADDFGNRARDISHHVADSLAQITTLSDEAAQRLNEAAGRIHAGLDGIRHNVAETAGSVERFGELGARMGRHRDDIEQSLSSALQHLDHLASRFQGEIAAAGNIERAVGEAAERIVTALAHVRAEQESAGRALDAFGESSQGVSLRLEGLRSAAVNGVSDLIGEADRLQRRTENLTDELKGQAIIFGETMHRADGIAAMIQKTGSLIDQALAHAGDVSGQLRNEFGNAGHEMDLHGERLRQQADQAAGTLAEAKERMEAAIAQMGGILGAMDGKAGSINFTVSSSLSRLNELTHGLERARDEVLGSSDKVATHIEVNTRILHESADRIRESAEHVTGASTLAAEAGAQLAGAGDILRDRVLEITRSADEATGRLKSSADDLSLSADRTKEQLGQIVREVRQENEAIDGTLARIANVEGVLRQTASIVDDIVAKAAKSAEVARDELHAVGREIAVQSKVLSDTSETNGSILGKTRDEMEEVVGRVQDAFGSLNQKASEINFVVSTAVNRLGELSRGLEGAQSTIDDATGNVSGRMSQVAAAMRTEFTDVHEIADRALGQLERTLAGVAATSANIDAETQTIEQRLAATFRAAETGGTVFAEKVSIALDRFEKAEKSLENGSIRLTSVADDTTAHVLKLTRQLAGSGAELGSAAIVTGERIAGASALVEARLQSINAIADEVRAALGIFAADLTAVSEQSGTAAETLSQRGEILRDNIVQISRSAEESERVMRESTASLMGGAMEVSEAAGHLRTKISRATTEMRKEAATIAETEAEARTLAGQVVALLGERAMEMALTARQVASETATMRDSHARMQRDLFLSAAKTVLDALNSLSVDISRVLDTDLPEELRTELVRGDIPAFVRRLALMRDQVSTPKLRAKFAGDSRFRTHVQAYLGQFEELVTQAAAVDRGEVLSATLVSSDIGKIYTFLSAAIGTERDDIQKMA